MKTKATRKRYTCLHFILLCRFNTDSHYHSHSDSHHDSISHHHSLSHSLILALLPTSFTITYSLDPTLSLTLLLLSGMGYNYNLYLVKLTFYIIKNYIIVYCSYIIRYRRYIKCSLFIRKYDTVSIDIDTVGI